MSPTRRDLFRRTGATIAAASIAALPAVPVAAQTPRLASLIDVDDDVPYGLAVISGETYCLWAKTWSRDERERFLMVIEREFPNLTADVIDHLEFYARREGAA